MKREILELPGVSFRWIDMQDPGAEDLASLEREYGLHPTSIQDLRDPEHLPKFEHFSDHVFTILRVHDASGPAEADTVKELTNKVAIFFSERFMVTIHRHDEPFIRELRAKWSAPAAGANGDLRWRLLFGFLEQAFLTYEKPIDRSLSKLEEYEMGAFGARGASPFVLEKGYYLKRRASVFKRMLRMSSDVLTRIVSSHHMTGHSPLVQDVRETLDSLYFYADELLDGTNNLLTLHISLASQRANEVMRVLTLFAAFFLPLSFITGLYGMNFEYMPEVRWRYGYFEALLLMVLVSIAIYAWFKRKGWLKGSE